jgi:signal transduction histidine kinase
MKFYYALILLLLCLASLCRGQAVEAGLPFIDNYSPKDYNANTQNWAIVQDTRGLMYFGNNKGVLEYDGSTWRLIPVNNNSIVRSLAVDSAGTIFVVAVGEFGFLAPDQTGNLQYHSLLHKVHEPDLTFSDVWTTVVHKNAVFFQSFTKLFRYQDGQITTWEVNNAYHRSFVVYDKFYLREQGKGLMTLENDVLVPVKGGEIFASEFVSAMLPLKGNVLIGSRTQGLFIMNTAAGTILPFNADINDLLIMHQLYHGAELPNGQYVFATINGGLIAMDEQGDYLIKITQNTGLQSKSIYYLYPDKNGLLWLGLANGISKVSIVSPISIFDKILGLEGGVLTMKRFKGVLYVGTHQGLFYIDNKSHFRPVENMPLQTWQMEIFNNPDNPGEEYLLIASTGGIYEIRDKKAVQVLPGRAGAIKSSRLDPYRVFVGYNTSLGSIRFSNGKWKQEGITELYHDEFRSIQEDAEGNIWLGTMFAGIIRIKTEVWNQFLAGKRNSLQGGFSTYKTDKGLPSLNWNYFHTANNRVLLTTQKGVYTYNAGTDRFEPEAQINAPFGDQKRWVYYISEDSKGNLWFDSDKGKGVLLKHEHGFTLSESSFKRMIVSPENQVTAYNDENDITWFGTPDGIYRYDNQSKKDFNSPYQALIRKVSLSNDSILFNGTYPHEHSAESGITKIAYVQPSFLKNVLDYAFNSLTFHFSASTFDNEGSTQFTYFLKGYDSHWSAWTKERRKEYTNLPEGRYTFLVKAKNFNETESEEAVYEFRIRPPWYRTQVAYLVILLLFGGVVYVAAKVYSKRLEKDNERLEDIVQNRTAEIKRQKERIETQKNEVEKSYQNVTTLSQIGQSITATLDLENIMNNLYFSITPLMDCFYLGVGTYNNETRQIDFKYAYEDGEELPPFSVQIDADTLMSRSFMNGKVIFSNNIQEDYANEASFFTGHPSEDKEQCNSIICVPLQIKDKTLGVIAVMSLWKNAYQPFHLDILRNLASYTAIALDNTYAYLRLNEINEELSATLDNLKTAQSHLVQSEKMASLGQLTAGVAHEINNPINFVSAGIDSLSTNYDDLSELLEKIALIQPGEDNTALLTEINSIKKDIELEYLLEEIPMLLKSINDGARRTTEIVKSLRNFTRLDEDNLKSANIHEGIDSTLVILKNQLADRVEVIKEYGNIPDIACYPGQLNQVFMNILGNAIQAIEGQGQVHIKTSLAGKFVNISIKDSGKGMSEEVKRRIFEPFFTTKDVGEGTGLGLSICYGIIEKHKGKIVVESTPGKGTEFIIKLPLILN